jgi:hypothetical protein
MYRRHAGVESENWNAPRMSGFIPQAINFAYFFQTRIDFHCVCGLPELPAI